MVDEYVTKDACARTREAFSKEIGNIGVEICSNHEDLTDMKVAIARLTIIQETLNIPNFWQSELGKKLIWGIFILSTLVLLVALGQNVQWIEKLLEKLLGGV